MVRTLRSPKGLAICGGRPVVFFSEGVELTPHRVHRRSSSSRGEGAERARRCRSHRTESMIAVRHCPAFVKWTPPVAARATERQLPWVTTTVLNYRHGQNRTTDGTEHRAARPTQGQSIGSTLWHRLATDAGPHVVDDLSGHGRPHDPGEHAHRHPGSGAPDAGGARPGNGAGEGARAGGDAL